MTLNEVGDFLAGAFGALAFFWLVLGYFMQNSELKLNRKSLEQQIEEFKKSVETQKQTLVFNEKKEDLREERRIFLAQSTFTFNNLIFVETHDPSKVGDDEITDWKNLSFKIKNWGQRVSNIKFNFFDEEKIQFYNENHPAIDKNAEIHVSFNKAEISYTVTLKVSYFDYLGNENTKNYLLRVIYDEDSEPYSNHNWDINTLYSVSCEEIH
jgi:hypothetical protein